MNVYDEKDGNPLIVKAVVLTVVVLFVIIGLIGLILPIIPGILFLGLAALLMSKVSSRFADYLEENALWQKLGRQWQSARLLSWGEKARLGTLWALRELVSGLQNLIKLVNRRRS